MRLITALGTGTYQPARYYLASRPERSHSTAYAPVASAALLQGVDEARVLLTPEAQARHGPACREELAALGVAAAECQIPLGRDEAELWTIFEEVLAAAEGASEVALDVTHALRHLPFVLFASMTYLTAFRQVRVRAVTYGAYEARGVDGGAPILDLAPLMVLTDWYHAVRSLLEAGQPGPLASALDAEARDLFMRLGRPERALNRLRGALDRVGGWVPQGLPLEGGIGARQVLDALSSFRASADPGAAWRPVLRTMIEPVERHLADWAAPQGTDAKTDIALGPAELQRELAVARWYCDHGQPDRALLLLREWLVNRWLLANPQEGHWLDYGRVRVRAERALTAWAERQRQLGAGEPGPGRPHPVPGLWHAVAEARNRIAHCGFGLAEAGVSVASVRQLIQRCAAVLPDDALWRAPAGDQGALLVAPLGLIPGALFTALVRLRPQRAVVLTSPEARPGLETAKSRAGWTGETEVVQVADAHHCFGDAESVVALIRPLLLSAAQVLVSLTGGTTALQYLVERVAGEAERLGVPVQRYAAVDRRDPDLQRRDPFVPGECLRLGGGAGEGVSGGGAAERP